MNNDFDYLDLNAIYLDSACQTLRPNQVIEAERDYYHNFNACGGRVKYAWGQKVDEISTETRKRLLEFLQLSPKDYTVAFTLNTTYGINLLLSQLPKQIKQIVTSDIEHNSVFLPTMLAAKKLNLKRLVLPRQDDGSLVLTPEQAENSLLIVNSTSNIDGRNLINLGELSKLVHEHGGLVALDAAQTMAHYPKLIQGSDVDAIFGSVHKFYGPSLGFIVIKKNLVQQLDIQMLGGGTVSDVDENAFNLIPVDSDEPYARLELGLQNFAGIVGFHKSLDWVATHPDHQDELALQLFQGLSGNPKIHLINKQPSAIVSFFVDGLDSHKLALYLSAQNIMARSGYFCCHYYLQKKMGYPPLLRLSLGAHNNSEQITKALEVINKIIG